MATLPISPDTALKVAAAANNYMKAYLQYQDEQIKSDTYDDALTEQMKMSGVVDIKDIQQISDNQRQANAYTNNTLAGLQSVMDNAKPVILDFFANSSVTTITFRELGKEMSTDGIDVIIGDFIPS